jgi:hypothetical protein
VGRREKMVNSIGGGKVKQEELTDDAITYILENIEYERLSSWEGSFIASISEQWERFHRLSDRQKEILGNIWDKQP